MSVGDSKWRKCDLLQELNKAKELIQFEIDAIEAERAKQAHLVHPNCRCAYIPYIGGDDMADDLMYGLEDMLEAMVQREVLSVKPIMVEVPEGADIDKFLNELTKKLEKAVITPDKPKKSEHITPVTEIVTGNMKTVKFMGNAIDVPAEIALPEALFFLLEHYVPVKEEM